MLVAGGVHEDGVETFAELGGRTPSMRWRAWSAATMLAGAAPGLHEASAEDQSREFVAGEHQWREIEVAAQGVADACLAFDRHARGLKVADVAIDGAIGDLEFFGEHARGLQAAATEDSNDTEESVGASHAPILDCRAGLPPAFSQTYQIARVQADVVAFGVFEAGEGAEAAGDRSGFMRMVPPAPGTRAMVPSSSPSQLR